MKYIRNTVIALGIILGALNATAQNEYDALLNSGLEYSGTARFVSMGSAMSALGGDASALHINPGAIGLFRTGEFTMTPTLLSTSTNAEYYGQENKDSKAALTLNNIAYVQTQQAEVPKWKFRQFAITNTRLKDFHNQFRATGRQAESSYLHFLADQVTQFNLPPEELESEDPFYGFPAYFTYLINPYTDAQGYFYLDTLGAGVELDQETEFSSRGRMGEMAYTLGGNYDDRLYIGASVGFVRSTLKEDMVYTESVVDTSQATLSSFTLRRDFDLSGTGYNFKIGAIYRFSDMLRVGASYHTPTWFSFNTEWFTSWESRFQNGDNYDFSEPTGGYNEFRLKTPSRLTGSIGLVIAKQGLINIEYEYLDYSGAKLKSNRDYPIDFDEANGQVNRQYADVANIRIGGEYRYKQIAFRAGYGYYPSPYESGVTMSNGDKTMYSGGLGWRQDRYSIDLAFRLTQTSSDFYPYSPDFVNPALLEQSTQSILATLGIRL